MDGWIKRMCSLYKSTLVNSTFQCTFSISKEEIGMAWTLNVERGEGIPKKNATHKNGKKEHLPLVNYYGIQHSNCLSNMELI